MKLPDIDIIKFDPNSLAPSYTPDSSLPTFWENYSEHIEPVLSSQQEIIKTLTENYNKLNDLYQLKDAELQESKKEAEGAKKYNKTMRNIAVWSAVLAGLSLLATIVFGILSLCA